MFRHLTQPAILLVVAVPSCLTAQDAPAYPPPPPDVTSVVTLAPVHEAGLRLTITGTIFKNDGATPYPGLLLYVYQTDATGEYHRDPQTRIPKLNGWLRTSDDGTYEIRTIRPGSYPRSHIVAHIHGVVKPADGKPIWIQDFLFEDDPYLSPAAKERARQEGRFSHILQTFQDENGTLRAVRNIVVNKN